MRKLADAEKRPGAGYWILYDGRGGVFRAVRDRTSGLWHARGTRGTSEALHYSAKTLRELRYKVTEEPLHKNPIKKPTVYAVLKEKLGREPTHKELNDEVKRILFPHGRAGDDRLHKNPVDPYHAGFRAGLRGEPKACPHKSGEKKRQWERGYEAGKKDASSYFAYGKLHQNPAKKRRARKTTRTKARPLHVNPKQARFRLRAETHSGKTYYYNHAAGALDTRGEYATHFPASKLREAMKKLAAKVPSSIKFIEAVKV